MIMRTCVILNPAAGRGWSPERIRGAMSSIPGAELRVSPTSDSLRTLAFEAVADGFGRIVAAYHDDMVRVCGFVARDEELARDAVQTAWSIAWRIATTFGWRQAAMCTPGSGRPSWSWTVPSTRASR